MEKNKTSSSCKSDNGSSCHCSSSSEKKAKVEIEQNLHDIKQALERILHATSIEQIARVPNEEQADTAKIASVAKLHSHAAEAYAQLLDMLAKRH